MILLPIGHEQTTVRRLPWVTFGVMAICICAFLLTLQADDAGHGIEEKLTDAMEYYFEHPYLELDPEFEEMIFGASGEAFQEMLDYYGDLPPPSSEEIRQAEQEYLDRLVERALGGLRSHPLAQWGLIPSSLDVVSLFTHMFMHAGWLHLLGNMLILFLAGPFIEDVWGRPLYIAFYLVAGLVAALFHILQDPGSTVPMIGASGAIAGVMGAFLVRYKTTKIRFFYMIGFIIRGTFKAPAWFMIPLWFAEQVFMGVMTAELDVSAGVAYWAHIGGFVCGVGVAVALLHYKVEERYLNSAIESKVTLTVAENELVDQGLARLGEGNHDEAFRLLSEAAKQSPGNPDAAMALWDLAVEMQRTREIAPIMLRVIQHELRTGQTEQALERWCELLCRGEGLEADSALLIRLTQALAVENRREEARKTLRMAMLAAGNSLQPMAALKLARVAKILDPQVARATAQIALAGIEQIPEARDELKKLIAELEKAKSSPLQPV